MKFYLTDKEIEWHHRFVQKYEMMSISERGELIKNFANHMYNTLSERITSEMISKNSNLKVLIDNLN